MSSFPKAWDLRVPLFSGVLSPESPDRHPRVRKAALSWCAHNLASPGRLRATFLLPELLASRTLMPPCSAPFPATPHPPPRPCSFPPSDPPPLWSAFCGASKASGTLSLNHS